MVPVKGIRGYLVGGAWDSHRLVPQLCHNPIDDSDATSWHEPLGCVLIAATVRGNTGIGLER